MKQNYRFFRGTIRSKASVCLSGKVISGREIPRSKRGISINVSLEREFGHGIKKHPARSRRVKETSRARVRDGDGGTREACDLRAPHVFLKRVPRIAIPP